MVYQFGSLEDCRAAASALSEKFIGNGIHYATNFHNWTIEILRTCSDFATAENICLSCCGYKV